MRIPSPPYHGTTNGLLYAILTGGDCIGYDELEISDSGTSMLTPPKGTAYALLVVESDSSATEKSKVVRFTEDENNIPTSSLGMPLGDLSVYEVKGAKNLAAFKVIGIENGKTHKIRVQYFG